MNNDTATSPTKTITTTQIPIITNSPTKEKSRKKNSDFYDSAFLEQIKFYNERSFSLLEMPKLFEYISSNDSLKQHYAAIGIRKLLSLGKKLIN